MSFGGWRPDTASSPTDSLSIGLLTERLQAKRLPNLNSIQVFQVTEDCRLSGAEFRRKQDFLSRECSDKREFARISSRGGNGIVKKENR